MEPVQYITMPDKYAGRADFAVRVTGNSLEPIYFDGDHLLVQKTSKLSHGDLGVFAIGQEWKVRRYYDKAGTRKLMSLNVNIQDEPLSADVACVGRVIGKA